MPPPSNLQQALGLTEDDLTANRRGTLSARQVRQLRRSGLWNVAGALLIVAILAAILYAVVDKPLKPAQWIVAGLLAGAALLTGLYSLRQTRAASADGRVDRLTGSVRVYQQPKNGWFLEVEGASFRMPVQPWHVQSGARYHVYVAPAARRVVAMEPEEAVSAAEAPA